MRERVFRWLYGASYYIVHILVGTIIMMGICGMIYFVFKQPLNIVLHLVSNDTVGLSASLLGFQLAGVAILIAMGGNNRKLGLLEKIGSNTMVYQIFISSISKFLISIVLMLISLNFFTDGTGMILYIKTFIDYFSVIFFSFGIMFLFSSIQLLKYLCSK